jgi:hypothetical protein
MSNSVAIALITVNAVSWFGAYLWASKWAHELASEIISGVVRGLVVPIKWRWLMLYQKWVTLAASAAGAGFAAAALNVVIALRTIDAGVATVAYLMALFGVCIGVGWTGAGLIEFAYLRSVLRQAEAD